MSTAPPPASATRRKQPAGDAPSPLSSPQQSRAVAIFAIFGNIFSGGLYLAQAPTLWTIHKDGEVGANNVDIFLATLISSIVWLMYGLADPFTRAVVIINALGIGFEVFGLVIFLFYSAPEGRVRLTIGMAMITVAASISAASVYTYAHDPRYVLGIIGDCTSIIMYGGPIRQLIAVWQAKDTRHMSVLVAVTSLLNGTCWTVYGRLQKDTFILVPSAVGMASGLAQLGMWAIVKFFYPPA